MLRNLGLGLAALGHWSPATPLAVLASLFLDLIAAALGDDPVVLALVGVFSLAGTLWLVDAHWSRLPWAVITPVGRRATRRRPVGALILTLGIIGLAVAVAAAGPTWAATVLAGLIPSSGGSDSNDPDARGGVNDGDNEVSASERPQSVGFTEGEVYLESDKSSLYDSFNEQYGEPVKPKNKRERMIALGPQDAEARDMPTENHQAGRTFAAVRQPRPQPRLTGRGADRAAMALFYVKGPTPLHIPFATFDRFDGVGWAEERPCDQHCSIEAVPGRGAWLRIDHAPGRNLGASWPTRSRSARSNPALSVPANVDRFKVGSVDRPEFFGWARSGLLRMVGRTVPAGTRIDTESRTISPRRLRATAFEAPRAANPSRFLALPEPFPAEVGQLVASWAGGIPCGWAQIEAVVAGVRRHCRHEPDAHAPGDCRDVVAHFLAESRCGPDHHFASAAAVALRSLGYPTRVVSGYYAGPAAHDARTRHTPLDADDVHFWCEVQSPGGPWVAVEPTPGYDLMPPVLDLDEQVMAGLCTLVACARSHAGVIVCPLLAGPALFWQRRRRRTNLATAWWWVTDRGPARRRVLRAAA